MKEKDRTRRYDDANGFMADVMRHLGNRAGRAPPWTSRPYRLVQSARKHRAGAGSRRAWFRWALVAGVVGTTWGLFEARRAADAGAWPGRRPGEGEEGRRAGRGNRLVKIDAWNKKRLAEENEKKALAAADARRRPRRTVEGVLGFVEEGLAAARPSGLAGGLGCDVKADATSIRLASIKKDFPDKPLVEARLRARSGSPSSSGKPQIAVAVRVGSVVWHGTSAPTTRNAPSMANPVTRPLPPRPATPRALKLREGDAGHEEARLGLDHPDRPRDMPDRPPASAALGRHAEAVKLREETLALSEAAPGPTTSETLASKANRANSYAPTSAGTPTPSGSTRSRWP